MSKRFPSAGNNGIVAGTDRRKVLDDVTVSILISLFVAFDIKRSIDQVASELSCYMALAIRYQLITYLLLSISTLLLRECVLFGRM